MNAVNGSETGTSATVSAFFVYIDETAGCKIILLFKRLVLIICCFVYSNIIVANKVDSVLPDDEQVIRFKEKCEKLSCEVVYVSAVTGEGLDELVRVAAEKLRELPPITIYETEITPEDEALRNTSGEKNTIIRRENEKYIVEGEWLFNFMGQINFSDYESLNFFQRVLVKNGVIEKLREAGIKEGDTVNIYDFEFDFVY